MTNNTTPTETVDKAMDHAINEAYLYAEKTKDAMFADMDNSWLNTNTLRSEAKSALRKAFESAMEAVIGEDQEQNFYRNKSGELKCSTCLAEVFGGTCDCTWVNARNKKQRQSAKEQIKLMFGE